MLANGHGPPEISKEAFGNTLHWSHAISNAQLTMSTKCKNKTKSTCNTSSAGRQVKLKERKFSSKSHSLTD